MNVTSIKIKNVVRTGDVDLAEMSSLIDNVNILGYKKYAE